MASTSTYDLRWQAAKSAEGFRCILEKLHENFAQPRGTR
jgi:hypothetical protein